MREKRIELFNRGLALCKKYKEQYPGDPVFESIENQIVYLVNIEKGTQKDRTKLKEIVLGVLAAREVESLDSTFAQVLYDIDSKVKLMRLRL